ncbi:hypothetical protein HPG69_005747 [Diceros bicornis minor]|uniref:Uncharacterized protein n=1 Tax=Diceros bicornis minor TaxID=77932 RepID=A0A7J7ESR3_DICBM|nr:hypothetical protein HPG69_005747 [Diceros bicornis minor]
MASKILVNIKEEVTCPICQILLTEPLSLDCGHSFCQSCITAEKKESKISQEESSCPVCGISYQPGNLRPNRHMANIVERLREVKLSPEKEQKRDLCVSHEEKLLLFCKEDGKEHRAHHTFLIEEVAKEYQVRDQDGEKTWQKTEKLVAALLRLKEEQEEAAELRADVREERTSWKNKIQNETKRVQAEFNQMRVLLDYEEQNELLKLKNEEGDILHNLAEAENELVQHSQLVRALISDMEHWLQGSAVDMLQDVNDIIEKSETLTLKKGKTFPKEQRRVLRASDLIGKLQAFKGEERQGRDPQSVLLPRPHSREKIGISVYSLASNKHCNFCHFRADRDPMLLGGREAESSQRYSGIIFSPNVNHPNVYYRYRPQYGYWVIGLQNESEYNAFEDSSTSDPQLLTLSMTVSPHPGLLYTGHVNTIMTMWSLNLLKSGADKEILITKGEKPVQLTSRREITKIMGIEDDVDEDNLPQLKKEKEFSPAVELGPLQTSYINLTPEPRLWPQLQSSLHQCKPQGVHDCVESMIGQEGESSCPVRRVSYQPSNLRPNRHMTDIVEKLRKIKAVSGAPWSPHIPHRGDCSGIQKKLQAVLQRLREDQQEVENLEADDVNGIVERSETLTLKKPKSFSMEQRRVSQASHVIGKVQVSKGDETQRKADRDPVLLGGPDAKSSQHYFDYCHFCRSETRICPHYHFAFDVLGSHCFSSGKYYWEVDVSEKFVWILGVCSNERDFKSSWIFGLAFVLNVNHPENESEYIVYEDSSTSDPHVLTLSMAVDPCRVGVFLDYKACTVSFFIVTNHRPLMYIFSEWRFSCTVYSYFNPGNCPGPITLCQPSS